MKRVLIISGSALALGGVAAKLVADERSIRRDHAYVTSELVRVREMVNRTGATVEAATRDMTELQSASRAFRDRITDAAARIEQCHEELVALIDSQERMAAHLASVRAGLLGDIADAQTRLARTSDRIVASKLRLNQRNSLEAQVVALRGDVAQRHTQIAHIEAAAARNAALLGDAGTALATISEQRREAEAASVRAAELEERSKARQSRALELSRKLEEAQREIETLTSAPATH